MLNTQRLMLLAASCFCLVALWLGLSLPIISLEKFWVFENEISVLSAISGLWADGEILLALVVAVFSVVLPNIKLAQLLLKQVSSIRFPSVITKSLEALARWSMLDVFLVAVLVSALKLGALAQAHTKAGLYWLVGATLLSIALNHLSTKSTACPNNDQV